MRCIYVIVGIPHDKYGEVPRAYVVAQNLSEAEIHQFINEQVTDYKKLRGGIGKTYSSA